MKSWSLLLVMSLSCLLNQFYAQISGVINQYTPVTAISCNQVDVLDASFLSVGDRVLIIQMKGATINTTNSANFGTITNYNDCGNYEFANVTAINGTSVTLQYQLLKTYTIAGLVQLIRVPQYTNTTVVNTLTAQDWDGSTGGVLVMEVSGTLTLNAPISVNGKGFRGSFSSSNPDGGCGNYQDYFYPVSSGFGALKGEGIAVVTNAMNGGRGALGNGGGGGNKHNTGGGGGSNGTRGGRGGDQAAFCGQQPIGGEGGMALNYSTGRLFMGGGGGSPDFNDGVGSSGANGGGIVIIRAATLQSNNTFIESCGGNVVTTSNSIGDGAGGGGAGGAIALDVTTFSGNVILRVDGGDGGNIQTTYPSCFGPGGGGGTGMIQHSGSVLPAANVTTSFVPGDPGINVSNSSCAQQSYGASPGEWGPLYSFNLPFPEGNILPGTFDMGPDIEVCEQSLILTTNVMADSYLWSTGETTGYAHATVSGQYWLSVQISATGCWLTDTISVNLNSLDVDAGPDQTICMGENVTLHASSLSSNSTLTWNNGIINDQPFTPQATTIYTVVATSSNGNCTATDSVLVTVNPLPPVTVIPSVTSGCVPVTVSFTHANTNCASANWAFSDGTIVSGCGNQLVTFDTPGCYDLTLEVTSNEGCIDSADFTSIVCVSASPTASFSPVPSMLDAENPTTTMVNNSVGGDFYEWNFGDNTVHSTLFEPAHSYSPATFGSYSISLTVTNEDGCSDTAYGIVYMEGGSVYYVPNTFTPDGNEFNQVFRPVFESGIDPSEYNLKVFNRWGELIFESNDPATGWDGTYHDQLAQEGVYTWRIKFGSMWTSEREVVHGHVNLLK
ncbi:PKD domain-containing protein [Fluviicola sp.]|uniref:PKD domain-containing protein n=1 Tax=Fluviicola sp. TaxID=1917219 RepID=UPI0031D8C832